MISLKCCAITLGIDKQVIRIRALRLMLPIMMNRFNDLKIRDINRVNGVE
ncbi:hypothetical protein JCM19298_1437 [Nonlabens ulvanivorans]|nr:hypothetical protein JCM19298_1437 [Nonlabens ulvanivorans]